ncbi:RNA-directed DNA polymerase, eukaryota, reverse transcriptase zinc-binding domain protein [Tanacetum coccineum]
MSGLKDVRNIQIEWNKKASADAKPKNEIHRIRITGSNLKKSRVSFPRITFFEDDPIPEHCTGDDLLIITLPTDEKKTIRPPTTPLVGFAGHVSWPLGLITLPITLYDYRDHIIKTVMVDFMIVRAPSPYNIILGHPGMMQLGAVASTLHALVKFQTQTGITIIKGEKFQPNVCNYISRKRCQPERAKCIEDVEHVVVNDAHSDQTITIAANLPKTLKEKLCELLRSNKDVFSWTPTDMTRILRELAEHKLNIHPRTFLVWQDSGVVMIMIGWNADHVHVNLIHSDKQCMFCEITTVDGNKRVLCTFVYAVNGGKERKELWKNLITQKTIVGDNAWLMMGDMNVTLSPNEHSAGSACMSSDMNDFKDCINHIEMEDIVSSGLFCTWTKNLFKEKTGNSTGVSKKLDRIMGNEGFIDKIKRKLSNFQILLLTKKSSCLLLGRAGKLNMMDVKFNCLKLQLKDVQLRIDKDPYDKGLRDKESKCLSEYVEAMKDKEKLLYQKAKIKWLSVGDRNNAYFHRVLKNRNHKNIINSIRDGKGNLYKGKDVADQFVNHFQAFLGNTETVKDCDYIIPLIKRKLNAYTTNFMVRDVCSEEIKAAMFQIKSNKVPRLDGFTSLFFKKAWSIMGADVCSVIREFFVTGKMPIACCNVFYKCISKVITNRLKNYLGDLVSQNQSAFMPNRHIQDNILLSQELLKGYERKDGPSRVAMKIDIQKTYDTVNWKFLEAILKGFGFHEKMVHCIICCVTTTSFSINVNGESCGYFKGGRGLRQKDPMSPYLFTLVMEILNLIVQDKVENMEGFKYHFRCKQMKITHVCFADDLLMFCYGDKRSVQILKEAIEEFGSVSGLLPNYNKSTIIFGSMGELSKGKANVAWKNICRLKSQGGLGLRDLGVWNKALIIKHLWHIVINKNSLWIKWINTIKLKGRSIWAVDEDVSDSRAWKNILKLRNDVRKFIVMNVGNGETASVMYDNWCQAGTLHSFITHRDLYNARRNANMVVKDIVKNGICMWPKEWVSKYPVLGLHKNITLIVDKRDKIIWRTKDGKHVQFTMNQTYNDLGSNDGIVKWHKLVWFSQNIPKHSFILWIAIQNKLVTQDKIRK